jgi:hypothetical protein
MPHAQLLPLASGLRGAVGGCVAALRLKARGEAERASAVWQRALRLLSATLRTDAAASPASCALDLDDRGQVRIVMTSTTLFLCR